MSHVTTLLKSQKLQSTENDTIKQTTTTEKSNDTAKSGNFMNKPGQFI